MKRGDKCIQKADNGTHIVTVLGPEDFSGYEYNRPKIPKADAWELVLTEYGYRYWTPSWLLEPLV